MISGLEVGISLPRLLLVKGSGIEGRGRVAGEGGANLAKKKGHFLRYAQVVPRYICSF